jgi:hypothetical protein
MASSEMQPEARLSDLLQEDDELYRIINAGIKTARARAGWFTIHNAPFIIHR